jgi:hypothetical protein
MHHKPLTMHIGELLKKSEQCKKTITLLLRITAPDA